MKRLVAVGLPEKKTAAETSRADEQFVTELINEIGSVEAKAALTRGEVIHHRHPATLPTRTDGRPVRRVLKIDVASMSMRDSLLQSVRGRRPEALKKVGSGYIRRDLTEPELALERAAKSEARAENEAAGRIEWGVLDTEVVHYSHPRPFPTPCQSSQPNHLSQSSSTSTLTA